MIGYLDFQQQAEIDMHRIDNLLRDGDYGFAIFSDQQALEKYVKAYLMKFQLISKPSRIGHAEFDEIVEVMVEEIQVQLNTEKDPNSHFIFELIIPYLSFQRDFFEKIKKSEQKIILLWKQSLEIELDINEKEIESGLTEQIRKQNEKFIIDLISFLTSRQIDSQYSNLSLDRKKIADSIFGTINTVIQQQSVVGLSIGDSFLHMIKPVRYGMGKNSLSKQDTELIDKLIVWLRIMEWTVPISSMYSHEAISRYPTQIGDNDSITIYKEKKDIVLRLIQNVILLCNKIRDYLV